jgi:UDP-galactopyranose mutase
VIYDLAHGENTAAIRAYFGKEGVFLNGRFGNFEYLNMDAVVSESCRLAKILNGRIK